MIRSSIYTAGVLLFATTAFAQRDYSSRLRLKGPVKYAGVYHYGLGTWTRPGALNQELGPAFNTIYNNTCSSPYFGAMNPGDQFTDEGRLPGTNSPDKLYNTAQTSAVFVGAVNQCPEGPSSAPGSAKGSAAVGASYKIDGFQIGYCSQFAGPTTSILVDFREATTLDATRCAQGTNVAPAPTASFSLVSFPGNAGGPFGCWIVSLDLAAASFSFSMKADGNGNYATPLNGSELAHCFSWSFTFPGMPTPTSTAATGFFQSGVPVGGALGWLIGGAAGATACGGYDGTVWDRQTANAAPIFPANGASGSLAALIPTQHPGPGSEDGTGMSTQDSVRIDTLPTPSAGSGCFFAGGPGTASPFTSFHLELYTQAATVPAAVPGTGFCFGDGCAFNCGCVTPNAVPDPQGHHESGCANVFQVGGDKGGAKLSVAGAVSPAPGTITFTARMSGTSEPAPGFVYGNLAFIVKGNVGDFNGVNALSDGIKCANGANVRFGSHNAGTNGAIAGSWTYPNTAQTTPVSVATAQGAAQTAYYQAFYRNGSAASNFCTTSGTNFSNGIIIRWP